MMPHIQYKVDACFAILFSFKAARTMAAASKIAVLLVMTTFLNGQAPPLPSGLQIHGRVTGSCDNEGIAGIEVELVCDQSTQAERAVTDASGQFLFSNIDTTCQKWTIRPVPKPVLLKGIDTWDLFLLGQYILGERKMDSPYFLIGADVNHSSTITTFDLVELRKAIFGEQPLKPYRFLEASSRFPNPENPFNAVLSTEKTIINNQQKNIDNINFIACFSGKTSCPKPQPASVTSINWSTVENGNSGYITYPVYYTGGAQLAAMQFAITYDTSQLILAGPASGGVINLSRANFSLPTNEPGLLRFSWNMMDLDAAPVSPGSLLFTLTFFKKQNGNKPLSLSTEDRLLPIAWMNDGKAFELTVGGSLPANPKNAEQRVFVVERDHAPTQLEFSTKKAGKVRLVLMNAFGQRLALRDITVEAGKQSIALTELKDLPHGVYQWWIKLPAGDIEQGQLVVQ